VPDRSPDLLTRLFTDSHRALRRYVRGLVRSREAAEDIVQEAFLRTHQNRDSLQTPRAFLFTAARNLSIDARRHARIARNDLSADIGEALGEGGRSAVVSGNGNLEEQVLADERAQLLREAIEHLPPQCRAVFTLKVFHDCAYQEIADRLGISVKTVEKHVGRGLADTLAYVRRRYRERGGKP